MEINDSEGLMVAFPDWTASIALGRTSDLLRRAVRLTDDHNTAGQIKIGA